MGGGLRSPVVSETVSAKKRYTSITVSVKKRYTSIVARVITAPLLSYACFVCHADGPRKAAGRPLP